MTGKLMIGGTKDDPLTHSAVQCCQFSWLMQRTSSLDVALCRRMTEELMPCVADNPYVDHRGMSTLLGDDTRREIGGRDANPPQRCLCNTANDVQVFIPSI